MRPIQKTISLERDTTQAEQELRVLAESLTHVFLSADNKHADLDPREGYVHLAKTRVNIGFGVSHVQGTMAPSGDLRAVLVRDGEESVLTLSDFGRSISLQRVAQGRLCEQRVQKTGWGMENYISEISQAP